jgi:predicted transcriptional regulator
MARSRLEMYVDILKVLAHCGPMKITPITYKANFNCSVLKGHLGFLVKQGFVDEQIVGKQKIIYSITQRGVMVLKYFKELKQEVPII